MRTETWFLPTGTTGASTHSARAEQLNTPTESHGRPAGCCPRLYSTIELRAAAAALAAGDFRTDTDPAAPPGQRTAARWSPDGPLVRVWAGHSGAGASTFALALAEAASVTHPVRLVDAATPRWSALTGAAVTEVGAAHGWHRGHRGPRLVIDRLAHEASTAHTVPTPRPDAAAADLTVLDVGWTRRELEAPSGAWQATLAPTLDVIVSRVQTAALSQVEAALAATSLDRCLVVLIGIRRRTRGVLAASGPCLQNLQDRRAVLSAPFLPHFSGVGPGPLPRALLSAACRALDHLDLGGRLASDAISKEPS